MRIKQVFILHGIGGHAGIHWQQWLHDQLTDIGLRVLMPTLPDAERPDRATWLGEIKKIVADFDTRELVIVGHSVGATSAFDLVEQSTTRVGGLVSVSGLFTDYGAELNSYFLQVKGIDFAAVNANVGTAHVLYGDDDPYVPQKELREVADALHVEPVIFAKGGHLNSDAGFTEFPELLDIIKKIS